MVQILKAYIANMFNLVFFVHFAWLNWACTHLHSHCVKKSSKDTCVKAFHLCPPSDTDAPTLKEPCYLHSPCCHCISNTSFALHAPRRPCPTSWSEVRAELTWGHVSQYLLKYGTSDKPSYTLHWTSFNSYLKSSNTC